MCFIFVVSDFVLFLEFCEFWPLIFYTLIKRRRGLELSGYLRGKETFTLLARKQYMTKMNNYSIVEFTEESTVEIIPSSWILSDKKTTLWPKGIIPSILKKYLKNCTEPGTDWSTVKIRVLGQADTLANAEKKAQKAENTSHLSSDSDPETFHPSKRLKKKPSRFCTNSSDEENTLKQPNTRPKKQIEKNEVVDSENFSTRFVIPPFPESQDSTVTQIIECQENVLIDCQIANSHNSDVHNSEKGIAVEKTKETTKPKYFKHIKEEILTKIFTMIEEVKLDMATIRKNQQEIKGGIDALLTTNDISINKFSRLLPITSMESFNEIDNSLTNCQEDFVSLIKYLNLVSGETVNQLVPSVMKLIMKKSVSIQFSGCGKKKKRDFSATKIAAAVFEIVSRKLPNATRDEIFKRISKFLAESGDREGGRKERSNSAN